MLLRGAGGAQKLKSTCGLCDLGISSSRRAEDGLWVACLCKLQFSLGMSIAYFLYVGIALVLLCFIFFWNCCLYEYKVSRIKIITTEYPPLPTVLA